MFRAPSEPQEVSWASIPETCPAPKPASASSPERCICLDFHWHTSAHCFLYCAGKCGSFTIGCFCSRLQDFSFILLSCCICWATCQPRTSLHEAGERPTSLSDAPELQRTEGHAALNTPGSYTDNKVCLCGCKKERKVPGNKNTSRVIPKDYG